MTDSRLRMVAGPNGSGKSTLLKDLRDRQAFQIGQWLNPDEVQETLEQRGRIRFDLWKLRVNEGDLKEFIGKHAWRTAQACRLLW